MLVVTLPNRKQVSAGQYAAAWRYLMSADPDEQLTGFDWCSMDAAMIRRRMLDGLQDRINRHDRTMYRPHGRKTELGRRIYLKMVRAARRGKIRFWCRWCGSDLDTKTYLPDHARFCDASCRGCYFE